MRSVPGRCHNESRYMPVSLADPLSYKELAYCRLFISSLQCRRHGNTDTRVWLSDLLIHKLMKSPSFVEFICVSRLLHWQFLLLVFACSSRFQVKPNKLNQPLRIPRPLTIASKVSSFPRLVIPLSYEAMIVSFISSLTTVRELVRHRSQSIRASMSQPGPG